MKKWLAYCQRINSDPHHSTIELGINFLMDLFDAGLSYSSIGTARSVLSLIMHPIDGHDFGSHPLVSRFMKGMFMQRPKLPKHVVSYDPQKILNFLAGLPSWGTIDLEWLTYKVAAIIALSSGHRGQSICSLSLDHMSINAERVLFYIPVRVKNTSRSFHPEPISLASFEENESICPVRNVIEYIKATALNRKSRNLVVSYRTFDSISIATFGSYIKTVLQAAGINIQIFQAHSTRHASNSKKFAEGIPINAILKAGG